MFDRWDRWILQRSGGAACDLGLITLLGSLTANAGVPTVMSNIDLTLGAGVRF